MEAEWQEIETEYITTQKSYRVLAKKYGISRSAISDHGTKEGWVQRRKDYQDACVSKAVQKTAEKISEGQSELAASLNDSALRFANIINGHLTSGRHVKPIDLMRLAQVWQILHDSLQKEQDVDEGQAGGAVIMVARSEIDDGG